MTLTEKQLRELDAWIEINIFGKKVFSEMRGDYEFFYLYNEEKMSRRDKEKCTPRTWSEYNPMKNIIPDGMLRSFHTNPEDAWELLKNCQVKCGCVYIETKLIDGKNYWNARGSINGWIEAHGETLELALARFSKKLFTK